MLDDLPGAGASEHCRNCSFAEPAVQPCNTTQNFSYNQSFGVAQSASLLRLWFSSIERPFHRSIKLGTFSQFFSEIVASRRIVDYELLDPGSRWEPGTSLTDPQRTRCNASTGRLRFRTVAIA